MFVEKRVVMPDDDKGDLCQVDERNHKGCDVSM